MLWPDGTLYREQVNVSTHLLAGCCLPLGEGISDTISTRRHTELVSVYVPYTGHSQYPSFLCRLKVFWSAVYIKVTAGERYDVLH